MYGTNTKGISKIELIITYLDKLIVQGGPLEMEYNNVDSLVNSVFEMKQNNEIEDCDINELISKCDFLKTENSIMGHIRNKPYGYAGDFDIIDKLYLNMPLSNKFSNWDKYSLCNSASIAVQNRKSYFKSLIKDKLKVYNNLNLCNVASGPARDIKELYDEIDSEKSVKTTCVELDEQAIEFAKKLTSPYEQQIEFINKNILRFNSEKKFDIIWSAGLFDYFNDKIFVRLLSRFFTMIKPGGEIVIGNFNEDNNPSRPFMELFGEWYLIHRNPTKLKILAIQAGANPNNIIVEQEAEGVNLFLRVKN